MDKNLVKETYTSTIKSFESFEGVTLSEGVTFTSSVELLAKSSRGNCSSSNEVAHDIVRCKFDDDSQHK